jgi:hypothetical protein
VEVLGEICLLSWVDQVGLTVIFDVEVRKPEEVAVSLSTDQNKVDRIVA